MHQELMNQEVARLHRAEILRSSSRHRVEEEPRERTPVAQGLLSRAAHLARQVVWHPQASRAH